MQNPGIMFLELNHTLEQCLLGSFTGTVALEILFPHFHTQCLHGQAIPANTYNLFLTMLFFLLIPAIVLFITMFAPCDIPTLCEVLNNYYYDYTSYYYVEELFLATGLLYAKKQKPAMLTQDQIDAVVGMAHSDAHIEQRPNGSRVKICQGSKQKDLVFHLFDVFTGFVKAEPRLYTTILAGGKVRSE